MWFFFLAQLVGLAGVRRRRDGRSPRFALLPLRPQTLQVGLLASSLIGYLPVADIIVLVGVAVALGVPWSVLPVALACVVVQLLLCVVLSRAASTSMSALMASRRGRDLGWSSGWAVFVLYMAFVVLVITRPRFGHGTALRGVLGRRLGPAVDPARRAGHAAGVGRPPASGPAAAAAAVLALAGLGLAWWWWSVALRRSLTTVPSSTAGSPAGARDRWHRGRGRGRSAPCGWSPGAIGCSSWRDPMRRMPWLMVIVLTIIWPFVVVQAARALSRWRSARSCVARRPAISTGSKVRTLAAPADRHRPGAGQG